MGRRVGSIQSMGRSLGVPGGGRGGGEASTVTAGRRVEIGTINDTTGSGGKQANKEETVELYFSL